MPVTLVEQPGFTAFVNALNPNFKLPSRTTAQRRCDALCEMSRAKICELIHNVPDMSITLDGWTSRANDSYLVVTGHWLAETFKNFKCTLALHPMRERHNPVNLRQAVRREEGFYK